jgi:hypothetical protein
MTILLAAVLALAAGWCIGHRTSRRLRRASAQVDAIIRTTIPDPAPMPDWERLADKARIDEALADIETHWNEDAA